MADLGHLGHALHTVKHGIDSHDNLKGSLICAVGGAKAAAIVAGMAAVPVTIPILLGGAGLMAIGRALFRD